jgi:hypothetical protein
MMKWFVLLRVAAKMMRFFDQTERKKARPQAVDVDRINN